MQTKSGKFVLGILGVVGVILLLTSGWLWIKTFNFLNDSETKETVGTVVELIRIDTSTTKNPNSYAFSPKVSFVKEDGVSTVYENGSSSNPPDYQVGEKVTILYNGDDFKIKSFGDLYLGSAITGIIGLVFVGVGFGVIAFGIRRRQQVERLKTTGTPVKAKITEIYHNTSLKVNGRSPWKITAQSTDTALGISVFTSDNIWFDPSEFATVGKEVTVFVNMAKPKENYIDLSFLPVVN